jgi:ATP-dependent protease ClpP protease subunit
LSALGPVSTIALRINSDGGDVTTGFAIFNMLRRHSARKVVTIEGLAASMASVIAMVGDEIIMPENAMMMIHNPFGGVIGIADQVKSFGNALEAMQNSIVKAYRDRTKLPESKIQSMMDAETWLTAEDAVKLKFADTIETPIAIAASFNLDKFAYAPKNFGASPKPKRSITDDSFVRDVYARWNQAKRPEVQE